MTKEQKQNLKNTRAEISEILKAEGCKHIVHNADWSTYFLQKGRKYQIDYGDMTHIYEYENGKLELQQMLGDYNLFYIKIAIQNL